MDTNFILKNATDEALANAVEENVHDMFRSMARVLHGKIEETDQLGRYHATPLSPIFKGTVGGKDQDKIDERRYALGKEITHV